ncbi:13E12 repeat family protein [Tessaracoccus defluvii]|uniref:DUF222 domain-containing protein n=1 Tax=Tessaracoccus defluvii TaxID=1285901 RepID=A0A7H0H4T4_9ACTN|nr:HNH endonuclease signature motif containing protein [Tessaracoccus defluvii]QNP55550.1 hypothetical protein H9L22_15425 [Tessaracoccus defluvii]
MEKLALITAREAFADVREGLLLRRRGEAQTIRALCDLAACYRVSEAELFEPLDEHLVTVGGEGTPAVSEFLRLEVAGLLGCSAGMATEHIAAAIDLKFRHPRLYEAVQSLTIDSQRALRAARRCRELGPAAADWVTDRWLPAQEGLGWGAAFSLLDRLIITADADLAAERERKTREARGVWTWGLDAGAMNLTGRLDVLDARFLDVRLDELARLLVGECPGLDHNQRRAKALGLLANPAYALALLQQAAQGELPLVPVLPAASRSRLTTAPEPLDEWSPPPPEDLEPPEPAWAMALGRAAVNVWPTTTTEGPTSASPSGAPSPGPDGRRAGRPGVSGPAGPVTPRTDPLPTDPDRPGPAEPPIHPEQGRALPAADLGPAIDPALLTRLRPTLGLAVHIHSDALGGLTGAARVERAGHITTALLGDLLGEGHGVVVKVHPVIDLPNLEPADRYVPTPRMRRAVEQVFPREPFPFSSRAASGLDLDHTVAYRPGRGGQTAVGNLAPLSRSVHRAKTAGFWRVSQPEPGRLVWMSPLGYRYEVTPFGTLVVPGEARSPSRSAGSA